MREQSTTKGFAVLSAASIVVKLLSLFYLPFLSIILDNEGLANYSYTYQIFALIYVLTNSGIPVAISKMVSELIAQQNYKDAVKAFKLARFLLLLLGLGMSLLMILLAGPLTRSAGLPDAYLSVVALAPTVLITSVVSAYRGYFQGRGNMTPTAVSQVGEQVINTVFSLMFAALLIKVSMKAGVVGGTIGTTLGALFAGIYLVIKYEKSRKYRIPKDVATAEITRLPNRVLLRRILNYGVPITLSVGLQNAGSLVDSSIMVPRLIVSGLKDVIARQKFAILAQLNPLINVPITVISALSAAVLPAISAAAAVDDRKRVQSKINQALKLCFMVSIPSAVGLAVLSNPIFSTLFNKYPEYSKIGAYLLKFGSIVVVLMSVVQIQTTILQSIGKMYIVTASMVFGIIFKIVCDYVLVAVPSINLLGAVIGNIICFTVPLIINSWFIRKWTKYKLDLSKYSIRPIVASAFMGVIVYMIYFTLETFMIGSHTRAVVKVIPLLFSIGVGGFVYIYGLILVGGITRKDMDSLSPRITRLIPNFMKERMR
ncbi:MAG: polysaccharide biosynthesis protein [Bacillota bacterium]|nr:polysaccharide biosynthesis protein [Bacillota bacterium]